MKSFDMREASVGQAYDLIGNLVVPRPIAFVSTVSRNGIGNLAPFSYFMPGGVNPPSLLFCPLLGNEGKPKDTLINIEETEEFVVNLVTREMAEGMNQSAAPFPYESSEWPWTGLTPIESERVKPPRVKESPVQFECKLYQALRHGDQYAAGVYVIGEILTIHVEDSLLSEGWIKYPNLIARLGGYNYVDLDGGKVFELSRPPDVPTSS